MSRVAWGRVELEVHGYPAPPEEFGEWCTAVWKAVRAVTLDFTGIYFGHTGEVRIRLVISEQAAPDFFDLEGRLWRAVKEATCRWLTS